MTRHVWILAALASSAAALAQTVWLPLAQDGVHDPKSPALALLQQPAEALAGLPRDIVGNQVRWVAALDQGLIQPLSSLQPGGEPKLLESEHIIAKYGSMPAVKFPHRPHTLWLDCSNCHDHLFKARAGANRYSMAAILNGEQCGVCHGAVAFPLTECLRCHNTSNASLRRPATP